ncbi:MAG: stage III sporulation protein AF, partial [Oscillospiraceae bacterium]|nr:stage III sporulation protein AF [Oscillospiraceae bacterium]
MTAIKHWALIVCTGCIAISVIQSLLPRKNTFSVIKLMLTLYILVIVISPIQNISSLSADHFSFDLATDYSVDYDTGQTQALILNQTAENLSKTLKDALAEKGYENLTIQLQLEQDVGNNVQVTTVYVTGSNTDKQQITNNKQE